MAYNEQSLEKKSSVKLITGRSKDSLIHNFRLFKRTSVPNFPANLLRTGYPKH